MLVFILLYTKPYMSMKKSLLLPNGSTVSYWEYGIPAKPTIIMIHGFRGTHHGLEKVIQQLSDYHVIVPDLPGFGESPAFDANKHSLASYVAFVHDFITSLGLPQPPVLLGHSFGTSIASHYAAQHPTAISKLILINPIGAPALEGPRAILTRLAIGYYWLGRTLPAKAGRAWLSAKPIVKIMSVAMAKSKNKTMRSYIHDQHLKHFSTFANPAVVAEAFEASVNSDVSQIADHIQTPTLLIVGEKDDITPLERQRLLKTKIVASDLHIITNVGHLIHYEKPGEAATAIRLFLQQ